MSAVKVCSMYTRLHIAAAVVINTTVHREVQTGVLAHSSWTLYH